MALTPGGRSLDTSAIDAAGVGYFTTFNKRLGLVPTIYDRIASVVEQADEVTTQVWLSSIPAMREWTGPKQLRKFRGMSHTIRTKPYESSVLVPKADILDDKLGLYNDKISRMADAYGAALDAKVCAVFVAGVTGTTLGATYDGQNMIDTDHTIVTGGSSQTNQVTGALSATTLDLAFKRFADMRDDEGRPIVRAPKTLLTGFGNRNVARKLLGQDSLASGESNMDKGILNLIISPYITGTNWFVLVENPAAVILHIKRPVQWMAVDDPSDSFVFDTGNFKYGTEAEFGAAPGLWEDVVGGPGT